MKLFNKHKILGIPVIYFHSVANHKEPVPWSFLSYPIELFEAQIKLLHKKGYQTISMTDLFNFMANGKSLNEKSIVLQFDDGFLDNWVFAYPILKKYNMRATIFVNPEFVDPTTEIRPTLENVQDGSLDYEDLNWWGYLSWKEMQIMEDSGLIEIQSHSLTHTWYFSSDHIIDYHHPNDNYYWLFWNKFPDKKSLWFSEINKHTFDLGRPVYEHGKSLTVKKYFEDERLKDHLISFVQDNGVEKFFDTPNWKDKLEKLADEYKQNNKLYDRCETEEEYHDRIRNELSKSKELIEEHLNKQVDFLCWPGGGQNDTTFEIAYEVGYKSTTKGKRQNRFGEDPKAVSRVAANSPVKLPIFQKWFDLLFLRFQLNRGHGGSASKIMGNILKSIFLR